MTSEDFIELLKIYYTNLVPKEFFPIKTQIKPLKVVQGANGEYGIFWKYKYFPQIEDEINYTERIARLYFHKNLEFAKLTEEFLNWNK